METCVNCGKVHSAGSACDTAARMWAYTVYNPLAEDIGLDRLAPDSTLTRELAEPLRELAGNHCEKCGSANRPGASFCAYCGAVISPEGQTIQDSGAVPAKVEGPGKLTPNTLLQNRYRIVRKVAQGGMAAVYEALDEQQGGQRLAIKEMTQTALSSEERTQALKDFLREATILATLDHENLPHFDAIFSENAKYYLVMEFVQGATLESMLSAGRDFLPENRVIGWAAQLCSVLEYLHSQEPPIIYRDCKPGNIMVLENSSQIKLIDFGIARFHRKGAVNNTIAFGTAGYAPPEQYGNGQTDQRSDVYALGATLHHLLSGHDPGDNPFHWKSIRAYNPRVSKQVDNAIMRAVNLQPDARYQSIGDFALALGLQARSETVPLSSMHTLAQARSMPAPAVKPSVAMPAAAPAPVAPQAPKPAPVTDVWAAPRIAVSETEVTLGPSSKSRRKGQRINVVNLGGGELKGIVRTEPAWLGVSAAHFNGNTTEMVVTAKRRGLKTGKHPFEAPNIFMNFGRALKGGWLRLLVILWFIVVISSSQQMGVQSFGGAVLLALFGGIGALAALQVALWIVARHVRLLVPVPKQNVGRLLIDSNGGAKQVNVRVLARPTWLRLFIGWALVVIALAAELVILGLLLDTVFTNNVSGVLHLFG